MKRKFEDYSMTGVYKCFIFLRGFEYIMFFVKQLLQNSISSKIAVVV
jgi:hypothetical protein